MKAIKFTLVAVLVAALGFGLCIIIFPIIFPDHKDQEDEEEIAIPDGCDLEWDQKYIDSAYRAIGNGQFKALNQRRVEMTAYYKKMNVNLPQKCKETVDLFLRNRYQSRFIDMANSEFAGKEWPHYTEIRDINIALLRELKQGSQDLKVIKSICEEYGKVVSYNGRVRKQSSQRPSQINSHWNFSNTRDIINNPPSASSPVNHTSQYELSRGAKVKNILYEGHVAFLEKLVAMARKEILKDRTEYNYNHVFDTVTREIEQFEKNYSLYDISNSPVVGRLKKQMHDFERLLN